MRLPPAAVRTGSEDERVGGLQDVRGAPLDHYRWKRQVDRHGLEMLRPRERRRPQMPNQLPKMIEECIVSFSLAHPGPGLRRVASELAREKWGGIVVSANGVWKVLCRHGFNTRAMRLGLIAGYAAPYEPPRERSQSAISTSHGRESWWGSTASTSAA